MFWEGARVSDAFEHGFSDFGDIHKPAREVIVKTAEYLRRAIFELINIDLSLVERALGPAYNEPRGPLNLVRYLRGSLVGRPEHLAAINQSYPMFEWRTKLKSVRIGEDGLYQFEPDDTFTAKLGEGVQLRQITFEVWDGSKMAPQQGPATA